MAVAIKIENLSKQYRLGLVSTKTISHDLNRWWQVNLLGKEDPYLKIGEINDRTARGNSEYVWALKDINLDVQEGEVLGIIGKNGAGKSTLLKLLSRVTSPTTGTIKARGRIASLLEVGTGFHQEMTGRENIFMNGAIMGMKKSEIKRKFDEIVDFSGVERYIDTPVKRYSSGMTVRLGFAIAAHLEPEILVVDEVLAVGDAEFQKKAIGKIEHVSKESGRTVLFVSHNLGVVKSICKTGILLNKGIQNFKSDIGTVIDKYIEESFSDVDHESIVNREDRTGTGELKIIELEILGRDAMSIQTDTPLFLKLKYISKYANFKGKFYISINTLSNQCIFFLDSSIIDDFNSDLRKEGEVFIKLSKEVSLAPGRYYINIAAFVNGSIADYIKQAIIFTVDEGSFFYNGKNPNGKSLCFIKQQWEVRYD